MAITINHQTNDISATSGSLTIDGAATVKSDPTGVTGADTVTNVISLTQAEYDAIVTPDAATLYVITD